MSEPLVSSRLADIPFAGIRKVFEKAARLEAQGKKVIHFEIGRPDFDTPAHIKRRQRRLWTKGSFTTHLTLGPSTFVRPFPSR